MLICHNWKCFINTCISSVSQQNGGQETKKYILKLSIIILVMGIVIATTACEREEQMLNSG